MLSDKCYYCGRNFVDVMSLNNFIKEYSGCNLLLCKAKRSISKRVLNASCMGVDRKNSLDGYTKDNCVACCGICNVVKGWAMNNEEYLLVASSFIGRLVSAAKEEACQDF